MSRSIQQLAEEAIAVQDACNLSGLVHGWSRAVTELREILPDAGTRAINTHPICQLWASKVHELSGMGLSDQECYSRAYQECKRLAAGDNREVQQQQQGASA